MEFAPARIDESLKAALLTRGAEFRKRGRRQNIFFTAIYTIMAVAGLVTFKLNAHPGLEIAYFVGSFLLIYAVGSVICLMPIQQALKALNAGHKERAASLTRRALKLQLRLYPFSLPTWGMAADLKFKLMRAQSRFIEIEAMTYVIEEALPKSRCTRWDKRSEQFLKNYRAIALLQQNRHEEARALFEECLALSKTKGPLKVLMNNIAHCEVELGLAEQAYTKVTEALKLGRTGSKEDEMIIGYLQNTLFHALLRLGRLPEAEIAANESLSLGQTSRTELYLSGNCYIALGELKMAQGDLDEAEQHIRSGLEMMRSRMEGSYPRLIRARRTLATLLEKIGHTNEAAELREAAYHGERELDEQLSRDVEQLTHSVGNEAVVMLAMQ